jgi:hypothetical protein
MVKYTLLCAILALGLSTSTDGSIDLTFLTQNNPVSNDNANLDSVLNGLDINSLNQLPFNVKEDSGR